MKQVYRILCSLNFTLTFFVIFVVRPTVFHLLGIAHCQLEDLFKIKNNLFSSKINADFFPRSSLLLKLWIIGNLFNINVNIGA